MKKNLLLITLIFSFSCVGAPDADHGLVENLPAIINKENVFSFALRADNFTYNESIDINVTVGSGQSLVSTVIVTDYKGNDTTSIQLIDVNSSNIYNYEIVGNLVVTNDEKNDQPKKANIELNNFSGIFEWVVTNK
tara:strand:- start:2611 stop:3018 length:408 start_codon:yes stop_codon:yes gene_type:complete